LRFDSILGRHEGYTNTHTRATMLTFKRALVVACVVLTFFILLKNTHSSDPAPLVVHNSPKPTGSYSDNKKIQMEPPENIVEAELPKPAPSTKEWNGDNGGRASHTKLRANSQHTSGRPGSTLPLRANLARNSARLRPLGQNCTLLSSTKSSPIPWHPTSSATFTPAYRRSRRHTRPCLSLCSRPTSSAILSSLLVVAFTAISTLRLLSLPSSGCHQRCLEALTVWSSASKPIPIVPIGTSGTRVASSSVSGQSRPSPDTRS
jgi:hypothetical protein